MIWRSLKVTVTTIIALIACAGPLAAQRLEGEARTRTVAELTKACLSETKKQDELRGKKMTGFCRCYARGLVDRAMAKDLDEPDSPRTTAIIDGVVDACFAEVP